MKRSMWKKTSSGLLSFIDQRGYCHNTSNVLDERNKKESVLVRTWTKKMVTNVKSGDKSNLKERLFSLCSSLSIS